MSRLLFPHQKDALDWATSKNHIALFMEMRLGKTAVAIHWAKSKDNGMGHFSPRLIVAPLTVLPSWEKELLVEGVKPEHIHYLSPKASNVEESWNLVNYEKVRSNPKLLALPWQVIVLDESTRIRNPQAQITKTLLNTTIPYRAILSGLPAPESPMDYFTQFQFLYGGFLGFTNYWHFRKTLFAPDNMGWEWLPRQGTLGRIKDEVHSNAFVLTRKQAGIGSRKIYETRTVDMLPEQKRVYKKAENEFALELKNGKELLTKFATVKLLWMARVAGGFSSETDHTTFSTKKIDELLELLKTELKGEPVVVWFRFNAEIEAVRKLLTSKGIKHRHILGETTLSERKLFSQQFNRGEFDILLCQVKCAKFGVDFSRASTAVYYSNSYDYEDRAQSEDRILHPSKKEPLLYIDLVSKGTVDEEVVEVLRDKSASSRILLSRLMGSIGRNHE